MTVIVHKIQIPDDIMLSASSGIVEPLMETKYDLMTFGSNKYTTELFKFFEPVVEVKTDSLEDAFELTNLWEREDLIKRLSTKVSSSSVGDIFEMEGEYFMVDPMGFKKVEKQ